MFWEVERWQAPPDGKSIMPDRPQKYTGRGATLGWLHHVNLAASNVQACSTFFQQHLDFHHRAYIVAPGTDFQAASFLSTGTLDHDLTFTVDPDGAHGRLNHLAFAVQTREDITRAADILTDYDPASLQTAPGASWASRNLLPLCERTGRQLHRNLYPGNTDPGPGLGTRALAGW